MVTQAWVFSPGIWVASCAFMATISEHCPWKLGHVEKAIATVPAGIDGADSVFMGRLPFQTRAKASFTCRAFACSGSCTE